MRFPLLFVVGMLGVLPAFAQQPVLPGAPSAPAPVPAPPVPASSPASSDPTEVIGATYSVELRSGTSFLGTLLEATPVELTFQSKDLGRLTVQRSNIRQLVLLSHEQALRGFEYVGNGTRMLFAPTARNLRRGEGYVQSLEVILASVNYGITDNISVGLLLPIVPSLGISVVAITPKVSAPVTDKLHVGAGLLYAFADKGSGGVAYGLATYGTSDSNFTLGLGYGLANRGFSSTPVVVAGGNVRLSNRFFLADENYIFNEGVGGLLGVKVAAPRISGSLGFLYATGGDVQFVPAYLEIAYRFGKVARQ